MRQRSPGKKKPAESGPAAPSRFRGPAFAASQPAGRIDPEAWQRSAERLGHRLGSFALGSSQTSGAAGTLQLVKDPPKKRQKIETYPEQFDIRQPWYKEETSKQHSLKETEMGVEEESGSEEEEESDPKKTKGRSTWGPDPGPRETLFEEMEKKKLSFEKSEEKRFFDPKSATWYPFETAPVDHIYEQSKIFQDQVGFAKQKEHREHFKPSQFSDNPLYIEQEDGSHVLSEEGRRLGFNFTPNLQLLSHHSNSASMKKSTAPTGEFFSQEGPLAPFFGTLLHSVGEESLDALTTVADPLSQEDAERRKKNEPLKGQGWGDWQRNALSTHAKTLGLDVSRKRAKKRTWEELQDRKEMAEKAQELADKETDLETERQTPERYKGYPPEFEMKQKWFEKKHSKKMAEKKAKPTGRSKWGPQPSASGEKDHRGIVQEELETRNLAYEGKMGPKFLDPYSGQWTSLKGAPMDHAYEQSKIRDELFTVAKNKKEREKFGKSSESGKPLFFKPKDSKTWVPSEEVRRQSYNWTPNLQLLSHPSNAGTNKPSSGLTQDFYAKSPAFGPLYKSRIDQVETGKRHLLTTTAQPLSTEDEERKKSSEPVEGQGWAEWSRNLLHSKSEELGINKSRKRTRERDDQEFYDQTQISVHANRFAREHQLNEATEEVFSKITALAGGSTPEKETNEARQYLLDLIQPPTDLKANERKKHQAAKNLRPIRNDKKETTGFRLRAPVPPSIKLNPVPKLTDLTWEDPELNAKKKKLLEPPKETKDKKDEKI